jgi:hypothetical protein
MISQIILPTAEEKIDFEQFRFAFKADLQPVGPVEQVLVEDIVISRWRLNRIRKMEPGFFSLRAEVLNDRIEDDFPHLDPRAHLALIVRDDVQDPDTYGKMSATKAVSSAPSTRRSKSYSASKPSAPKCPILGMGLFRKAMFHPTPIPQIHPGSTHNPSVSGGRPKHRTPGHKATPVANRPIFRHYDLRMCGTLP